MVSDGVRDLVYPPVLGLARTMFLTLGLTFDVSGGRNLPRTGGAVLASNHNSFLDFIFAGLAARPSRRLVRFMAKDDVFTHPVAGPLMRGMHHIPVDRSAGAGSYAVAVERLRAGQVVGIFPEAGISPSFVLKDVKSGAARMAQAAGVPLVPMALWGGQRIWTKAHKPVFSRGTAISIAVGEPFTPAPDDDPAEVTKELAARISTLLDRLQRSYPQQPEGEDDRWWLPAHLGGTAPTPEQARLLDAKEAEERAAKRAARAARAARKQHD